ncbi:MAG: PQQ-like beta-propeller repeat protein [Pirellulaceae bacterium]|nr:PQQ-like beta-propeller repeat protein [Pirellulaceae bacterium]
MLVRLLALATLLVLTTVSATAADWSRFRGPNGSAFSDEKGLPTKWSDSAEDGLVWKTSLPGAGASSPVISGDKVFVTCYKGEVPASLERILVCASRKDGKILWQKSVKGKSTEDRSNGMLLTHGYSSSTPATDGEGVYVLYGKSGVHAYDLDGKELWHKEVGSGSAPNGWGSACSPIIYKNLVIVNAAAEGQALIAFDKKTGKEAWKNPAESLNGCWGTPILVDLPDGKQELVLSVPGEVWGFDPASGKFLWYCEGVNTNALCSSAVAKDGIVYAIGGGPGSSGAVAIKAGGKDDVSKTHLLWTKNFGAYVTSPVIVGGQLFWVDDGGIANCVTLKDGELVTKKRLAGSAAGGPPAGGPPGGAPPGGGFGGGGRGRGGMGGGGREYYASVVAGDGKLYAVSRNKGTLVISADSKLEVLATNKMDDASVFNAGPAIQDGQIYLRSDKFLYCIGKK